MKSLPLVLLLIAAVPVHAQPGDDPAQDRVAERHLRRARAALDRSPLRARDLERAERSLRRARARGAAAPIVEVVRGALPNTAADAAAMPDEVRLRVAAWAVATLERLDAHDPRLGAWATALLDDAPRAIELLAPTVGVHDEAGATAYRRIAAFCVHRDDLSCADRALELAIRAWTRDPTLVSDLAAVRIARGAPGSAAQLLQSELHHRPEDRALQEDLAGALLAAGRGSEALALWRRVAWGAENPVDRARLRRAGARAALEIGRPEAARVEARRALGIDPDDGEARLLLGLALAAGAHLEAAREALLQARARLGDDLRVERALEALGPGQSR